MFAADDVSLIFVGEAPGNPVLTVDNFFCDGVIDQLVGHAAEDHNLFSDTQASYPGKALRINNWIKATEPKEGTVREKLSENEHLNCLRRAMQMARESNVWTEQDESVLRILERGEPLYKHAVKANNEKKSKKHKRLQDKV